MIPIAHVPRTRVGRVGHVAFVGGPKERHPRASVDIKTQAIRRPNSDNVEDYYNLLGVTKNASENEIKQKYRALQRKYHPDIAGDQSKELSSKINAAYDVLTNRKARLQYDGQFKRAGFTTSALHSQDGLFGPLRERAVPIGEVEIRMGSYDAAIDWLQQWGATITFGCEVPFPAPLQVDVIDTGVRIAVISVAGGVISTIGELYLEIDEEDMKEDAVAHVVVTRVSKAPERTLPSEKEVLKALKNALRFKSSAMEGQQMSGFWATLMSGSLGFLPLIHFGDQDTAYDAYRIPKRCSMTDKH